MVNPCHLQSALRVTLAMDEKPHPCRPVGKWALYRRGTRYLAITKNVRVLARHSTDNGIVRGVLTCN